MRACHLIVPLTVALASACGDRTTADRAADALPAWEVVTTPRMSVGDVDGRDTIVFSTVTDARLHPSGALVVADGGAFGVRVFDARGALQARAGRRGRGPGEFTSALSLADASGDSVAIWDAGQSRWTLMHVQDGGLRNLTERSLQPAWMHAGILVQSALAAPPAWVPPLLTRLSDSSANVRFAHIERSGLLYVSQDVARQRWLVFRDAGAPIASLTLPDSLALMHVAGDAMVGVVSDSVGLQRVAVYEVRRQAFAAPDVTPASAPVVEPGLRAELKSLLRQFVTLQEMRYMTHSAYTAVADSLPLKPPPGARMRILEATDRGWRGVTWQPATGFTCGMIVGLTTPAGWSEGEVSCGWQSEKP